MLTLFRCATGEGWNGLMHDAMTTEEDGRCSEVASDCGSWGAIPFFVAYAILSTLVVLKMAIALILDNFIVTLRRDTRTCQPEDGETFVERWAEFDPAASGTIPLANLSELIRTLPPPLGLDPANYGGVARTKDVTSYTYRMGMEVRQGADGRPRVCFAEVLACLVRDTYKPGEVEEQEAADGEAANGLVDAGQHSWSAQDSPPQQSKGVAGVVSSASSIQPHSPARASFDWAAVLPPPSSAMGAHYRRLLESKGVVPASGEVRDTTAIAQSIAATRFALALKRRVLRRVEEREAACAREEGKNGEWHYAARLRKELERLRAENSKLREEMSAAQNARGARELI